MASGTDPINQNTFAAIDLGSNSFHMIIARLVDDELQVVCSNSRITFFANVLDVDEEDVFDTDMQGKLNISNEFQLQA